MLFSMLLARVSGTRVWECPDCGHLNKDRVGLRDSYKSHCRECQHKFVFGIVFYRPIKGAQHRPPDMIMSAEPWRSGHRINKIVCESCTAAIVQDMLEQEQDTALESA